MPEVIAAAYNEFRNVNANFKALVPDWQVKDGQPNTHKTPNMTLPCLHASMGCACE